MSVAARIGAFAALLALVLGVAALAGRAASVAPRSVEDAAGGHGEMAGAAPVGLSLSEDGLLLALGTPTLPAARATRLSFRILGEGGRPETHFDVEHARKMHAILVRRDLSGFQHVHPRMAADGTWSVPVTVAEPGAYRLFADFSTDGTRHVLGLDLDVPGTPVARSLPAQARVAVVGRYRVALDLVGGTAGETTRFRFTVSRSGVPIEPGPYLGARGHLVVLRQGDLAYVHAHPEAGSGPAVEFESTLPSAGRYRAFLQVSDRGRIVTAPFTIEVTS